MAEEQFCPLGWKEELEKSLDLEAAYTALERYEHFHSYTLRGTLRHVQVRLEEAMELYEEAESRYATFEATPRNRELYSWLMGSRLSTRIFQESLSDSSVAAARTDDEVARFLSIADVETSYREKNVAFYDLLRGNYQGALETFQRVIEANRKVPEGCIGCYICAAAAAHELGLYRESRRQYENAELTMCCNCNRFVFSVYLTWLLAVCQHWGWESERQRWVETIRVLECPEATRDSLFERAHLLQQVCRSANAVVFA